MSVLMAERLLRQHGLEGGIERRGPLLASDPVFVVLRREHAGLLPRIEKARSSLLASGEWVRQLDALHAREGIPAGIAASCLRTR